MKWIGQHIYDLVARFRSDLYLDNISTSTETDVIVVNSEGKLSKRAASGLTVSSATLASTVTVTDSNTATAFPVVFHDESNALLDDTGAFTYNPNTGTLITPNLTVSGTTTTINTTNLNVEDKNITLNYNDSSDTSGTADGAGITIQDAVDASNNATILWTAASDTFTFSHNINATLATAAQTNITSLGTLTSLDVDSINLDDKTITITGDTNDTFTIVTGAGGATDITTTDTAAAGGHLNVLVDGILSFSSIAGSYNFYPSLTDTGNKFMISVASNGVTSLTTTDAGAGDHEGHLTIQPDGDLILGATGQIKLEPEAGNNILLDGVLTVDGSTVAPLDTAHNVQGTSISIRAGNTTAGTTNNITGGLLRFDGGKGKGTGDGGDITFRTAPPGSSGSSLNSVTERMTISGSTANSVVTITGDTASASGEASTLKLKNTGNNNKPTRVEFIKDKGAAGADGDSIGYIRFNADNAAQELTDFASIIGGVATAADTDEAGSLNLTVAASNGTTSNLRNFIIGTGHGTNDIVDVSIGYGATSTTTVNGTLLVNESIQYGTGNGKVTLGVSDGDIVGYETDSETNKAFMLSNHSVGGKLSLYNNGSLATFISYNAHSYYNPVSTIYNFGIGTSSPTGRLHVVSNANNEPAILIDNNDVDQPALTIDAENTTADVINLDATALTTGDAIYIDCNALTTGSAINIDIDDALTTNNTKSLAIIDYDKSGALVEGQSSTVTGLDISLVDAATNNDTTTVTHTGVKVAIDAASNQGTISQIGYSATLTDGDVANTTGYYSNVEDGGIDFKAVSSADTGDYFSIATTTNGATTLTTVDDDTTGAHLTFDVDGFVISDSAAGRYYWYDNGNTDDYLELTVGADGDSKFKTLDVAATAAHFEIEADGNITLDAAGDIALESGADSTNFVSIDHRKFSVSTSTDGNAVGDVVYFGGTTSMTIGKIYHYKSDGTWEIANADAVATADGLLAVALGAASDTNGMLLRGMVTLDHDPGAIGDVLYVQSDNAGTPGNATATAPSASGDCVRIIGYQVSHASNGNIWFNPDNTFVEVA